MIEGIVRTGIVLSLTVAVIATVSACGDSAKSPIAGSGTGGLVACPCGGVAASR
jgi:hypothetical protein